MLMCQLKAMCIALFLFRTVPNNVRSMVFYTDYRCRTAALCFILILLFFSMYASLRQNYGMTNIFLSVVSAGTAPTYPILSSSLFSEIEY